MACLYIDQLKSHFPKIEPSLLRTKPNGKWCPQVLLKTLGRQTSDDYDISNEFAVRNAPNNFLPKVPKIFAIGLRLDREDADNTSVSQCRNIDSMKTYLKDYFAIIRSYQNYFCTPWKSDLEEPTDGSSTCPFNSHEYAIIAGCPTKLDKKSSKEQEPDRVPPKGNENDSKSKEWLEKCCDLECVAPPLEPFDAENMAVFYTVEDKIRKKRSNCTMTSTTNLFSSEKKDREYTGCAFPDSRAGKSKRHVSVQTEDPGKSRHGKSTQCNKQKQTEIAAAKDVQTIFAVNSETFDKDTCNTDSELPRKQTSEAWTRAQRSKTEERSRRKCGGEKSSKRKTDIQLRASMNTKENIYHLSNGVKGTIKKERRRYFKKKGRDPMRNVILFDKALSQFENSSSGYTGNNVRTLYQNRKDNPGSKSVTVVRNEQYEIRRILGTKVENYADPSRSRCTTEQSSYESLYSMKSTSNHLESKKAFWEAWNYSLEDKSSELTILGNVKKRLEEDYDDYFSFKDIDLESELFVDAIDLDSCTKVKAKGNDCPTASNPQKSKSMSTTLLTKHQELHQRQLRVQSFRTSLTRSRPSSLQILNTDLHRMERCSCHDSLKEQERSTGSSIEYCTASSLSLTNLQSSSRKDSVSMLFQSCSVDTRMPLYQGNLKPCGKRHCFSKDSLLPPRDGDAKTSEGRYCYFEEEDDDGGDDNDDDDEDLSSLDEDEAFLDSRDFADRTLLDSCTVCYYRRKSAPKFAKSSKLVESLDSGILTDCSRGGRVRIVSEDRLRWTVNKNGDESRRCCASKSDLLPTYDFDTDSSYSDESLDRRVDMAVRKFTENLILSERRARSKLLRTENPSRRRHERKRRKKGRQVKNVPKNFPERSSNCVFESSPRFYDDDWLISSSSPPLYSFSESEMDHL